MIQIKNLTKEFGTGDNKITVLNDNSLNIEDGDIFGIIGMSGAGKSTLIRCMNLLERPTKGSIQMDGVELTTLSKKELLKCRTKIGMIFQSFNLHMQRNVRRNASFGLELIPTKDYLPNGYTKEEYEKLSYLKKRKLKKEDMNQTVDELLKIVDLTHKADAYPSQLSGGQRQRVAIARALATYPSVLLCDEATSALDSMTTEAILQLLQKINKERNITIVIITHEIDVVQKICNKVAVIDKSRIVEMGETKDIFANPSSPVTKRLLGGEKTC